VVHPRKPPLRTCVACGRSADKRELVRVVRDAAGDVSIDVTGKANGRGAYVCGTTDCFDTATRRSRFDAALRVRLKEDDLDRLRREFARAIETLEPSQQGW
jgi:hypothetical protein